MLFNKVNHATNSIFDNLQRTPVYYSE